MMNLAIHKPSRLAWLVTLCASPAVIIFLSSNFVNVGNLAFNMIFSRWMGPELFGDLAVVLTIKLALLGVLGALSSSVSHHIAALGNTDNGQTEQALARINRICFKGLWIALPLLAVAIYFGSIDAHLDLGSPYLLYILLCSLPFCAPLNFLRGVALGRMDSRKIVYSANAEMAVRLGLGMIVWQLGLGIEGVVAAIGASIIAGWVVLSDVLPAPRPLAIDVRPLASRLGLAALPFAILQLSQVAVLDGDIFLATRYLSDTETGFVAALSLFQRIQFFACFALASVLLPSVVIAIRDGQSYRANVTLIAGLVAVISTTLLTLAFMYPQMLLTLLVGANYIAAAPHLVSIVAAAMVFTINYLIATFLMAQGQRSGIVIVVAGATVQIALMIVVLSAPTGDLAIMLKTKLLCQFGVLIILLTQLWMSTKSNPALQERS